MRRKLEVNFCPRRAERNIVSGGRRVDDGNGAALPAGSGTVPGIGDAQRMRAGAGTAPLQMRLRLPRRGGSKRKRNIPSEFLQAMALRGAVGHGRRGITYNYVAS